MMKQLFLLGLLITVTFFSCRKSNIDTVQTVSLTVQLGYNAEDSALGLSKANIPVKITNLVSGQDYTANTNANGVAVFANIAPSSYTISAANNLTAEQYLATTGVYASSNVAFNATTTEAININTNIKLQLQGGKVGNLLIKQFYYAGSNITLGASFRDQFVEIYNNSNELIYLDSLYFGNTWQNVSTRISAGGLPIDWSQSPGMSTANGDPNKNFIYAKYLFMIPGTGKQHPLAPGKSIIIAVNAINHTQEYTLNNGTVQSITNPDLSVDLSKADFETYLVEYDRSQYTGTGTFSPYRFDVDNPQIPNVEIIHVRQGNEWTMDATGRDDFFIFKTSSPFSFINWPKYSIPGSPASFCAQVKLSDIIDAVEVITPLESNRYPRRLPISLDATGTFVTGGQYSSQSLIRKTVKTVEGRRILQDTNNSANDFETKTKANPSKTDASFLK